MDSYTSYLCGMAAAIYLAVGLAMSAVRWFHMCRPYDRKPSYYYPGRPFAAGILLSPLILLPYALHPDSGDAWYLARLFFLPATLYHFTILLFAYFGSVMQWKKWRTPVMSVGILLSLFLLAACTLAVWPGEQVGGAVIGRTFADIVLYALGIVVTVFCFSSVVIVMRWARLFDEDDYSNPADFPVVMARRWLVLTVVNAVLCWTGALSASKAVMAVIILLFTVSIVLFIISVLHPHRSRPPESEEDMPGEEETSDSGARESASRRNIPAERRKEILAAIRDVVERQEAFLEPHLTLQDVAVRSGYNRTYVSSIIKSEYGGFFHYVNRLRLRHVDAWLKAHPGATVLEAIESSGFNSRQAYHSVKSKLENIN